MWWLHFLPSHSFYPYTPFFLLSFLYLHYKLFGAETMGDFFFQMVSKSTWPNTPNVVLLSLCWINFGSNVLSAFPGRHPYLHGCHYRNRNVWVIFLKIPSMKIRVTEPGRCINHKIVPVMTIPTFTVLVSGDMNPEFW